jgi:hypothetical protein
VSRKIKLQVAVLATLVAGTAVILTGVDRAVEVTNYDQSLYIGGLALVYLAGRAVARVIK